MYEETRRRSRGVANGAINDGLSMSTTKSKVGLHLILSCMNLEPPAMSTMHRKMNSVCDLITEINRDTLVEKQNLSKSTHKPLVVRVSMLRLKLIHPTTGFRLVMRQVPHPSHP